MVCDLFWCYPDAVKLCNACHLVFLIDSTYKTNRYRLPLLDFVVVTPTRMTFSAGFAYLEGERVNNVVWALERFHIDKNVKAKCKSLTGQKNAWEYVMDAWGSLVDCPSEQQFAEVESAHWALKRVLHNSLGDLCSVWDAMNNMITLQHTQIKASFETSTHVVGHVFKKNLIQDYAGKNPSSCGCVMRTMYGLPCACELSRYAVGSIPLDSFHMFWRRFSFSDQGLCEAEVTIKEEIETISKRFKELDVCGKVTLKSKLREIAYPDQNSMCPPPSKVNTKGAPKKTMNRNQRSTKRDPSYWEYVDAFHFVQNSNSLVKRSASSSDPPKLTRIISMLDQFEPFIQGFIDNIVDVKVDAPCGACRTWIFFINRFLCLLRSDCSGMEKEKDEWRRHFN
ncbi:hypothetical protein GmHk_18G052370 [Glycine max]|nr:hypothetical protein GmHk_18G052370 [Glycine max]